MKSSFKLNGGTCRQVGDYRIPNITLPAKESRIRLGKWGMLRKDYMLHHKKSTVHYYAGTRYTLDLPF